MLLLTGCAGCTAVNGSASTSRNLPSPPAFARPVTTADMRSGESCWIAYDRKRSGEQQNASIVHSYNRWYAGVRQSYSSR